MDKTKLNLHAKYLKTEKDKLRIELYEEEMLKRIFHLYSFTQRKHFLIMILSIGLMNSFNIS